MSDATLHDAYTHPLPARLRCHEIDLFEPRNRPARLSWRNLGRGSQRVSQVGWLTLCGELGTVTHQVAGQGPPVPAAYLPRPTALPANPFIIHEGPDQGTCRYFQVQQGTRGYSRLGDEYSYHPLVGMGSPLPGILPGGVLLCTLHHSCEDNVTIGGTVGTRQDY